ncbi:hypothetical protein LOZ58_003540 [Ophidiomyces ophidiicola]|nr:hypothetical protein LOZ58_003540 [Ophidiomyces ophidiicola]
MTSSECFLNSQSPWNISPPPKAPSRTLQSNRVYGRRKLASAKAVLEKEDSASKKVGNQAMMEKATDKLVDDLRETLAAINLEDVCSKSTAYPEVKVVIKQRKSQAKQNSEEDGRPKSSPSSNIARKSSPESPMKPLVKAYKPVRTRQKRKQKSPLKAPSIPLEDVINDYARPILREAIASKTVQDFNSWADRAAEMFDVEKIAEGSYGEVYQLHVRRENPKRDISKLKIEKLKEYDNGVFKIVPLRARAGPGSKKFTSIPEVVAEVQMLKLLDAIPGFARYRDVHVVQGRFPASYQAAWTRYSQTRDDCYNPDPSKKKSYPDTQLWAILEMDNAGSELEKFDCSSIFQIYDIFWGVALALARAEQFAAFEHRDLHLGNICIKSTKEELPNRPIAKNSTGFGLSGLESTIIDYSLSRADILLGGTSNGCNVAWSDLDKKQLFDAIGRDDDERLLRDTYRLMRAEVYENRDSTKSQGEPWKGFNPRTNLIWLSFLLTMLLTKGQARGILPASRQALTPRCVNNTTIYNSKLGGKEAGKSRATSKYELLELDFQRELLDRLQTILDILEPENLEEEGELLHCTGSLVAFAIGSQWLAESDFLC